MVKGIPVNPNLTWDYMITERALNDEKILTWYLSRVLSHGTSKDVKTLPLTLIKKYLPKLTLSKPVFNFWKWYLSYVHPH
ncbi:hypothetical protein HYW54_01995 [Candidatus Gottesmanbacteria bacterium]|nr:hypothetical protein [Candidatus Gottesmanbacteria bacterium]